MVSGRPVAGCMPRPVACFLSVGAERASDARLPMITVTRKTSTKIDFFFGTFFRKLASRHPRNIPDTSLGLFRASTTVATLAKSPNGS